MIFDLPFDFIVMWRMYPLPAISATWRFPQDFASSLPSELIPVVQDFLQEINTYYTHLKRNVADQFTEYPLPEANSEPGAITNGPTVLRKV
jgi:hypothetical protein